MYRNRDGAYRAGTARPRERIHDVPTAKGVTDMEGELIVSQGRIIIQPSSKVEYDLDTLVSGIDRDNTHDEVSFGPPVGAESL